MKRHVAWQPHVDAESLLNPFVPPEWRLMTEEMDLDEAHRDEIEIEIGNDEFPEEAGCERTPKPVK
jgi:hypothetical protein